MTLNVQNLDRLISHLEGLPEERFNMGYFMRENECGTVCCIAGHIDLMEGGDIDNDEFLGMTMEQGSKLIMPPGYINDQHGNKKYPLSRAIRTLKHMRSEFLRTGQVVVDWDAPEPVARKDWAPPMAREQQLPVELTALLSTFDRVEVQS